MTGKPFPGFRTVGWHEDAIVQATQSSPAESKRFEDFRRMMVNRHNRWINEHNDVDGPYFLEIINQPISVTAKIRSDVGLTLTGSVGVGKTKIARSLHYQYTMDGADVVFRRCQDLVEVLKDSRLHKYRCLILDDLGVDPPTPKGATRLDDVIDARRRANLVTIITTNLQPKQLAEMLGPRAYDRLTGEFVKLPGGVSRRQKPPPRPSSLLSGQDVAMQAVNDGGAYRRNKFIGALYDHGLFEALNFSRYWIEMEPEHEQRFVRIMLDLYPEIDPAALNAEALIDEETLAGFAASAPERSERLASLSQEFDNDEAERIATHAAEAERTRIAQEQRVARERAIREAERTERERRRRIAERETADMWAKFDADIEARRRERAAAGLPPLPTLSLDDDEDD